MFASGQELIQTCQTKFLFIETRLIAQLKPGFFLETFAPAKYSLLENSENKNSHDFC